MRAVKTCAAVCMRRRTRSAAQARNVAVRATKRPEMAKGTYARHSSVSQRDMMRADGAQQRSPPRVQPCAGRMPNSRPTSTNAKRSTVTSINATSTTETGRVQTRTPSATDHYNELLSEAATCVMRVNKPWCYGVVSGARMEWQRRRAWCVRGARRGGWYSGEVGRNKRRGGSVGGGMMAGGGCCR